MVLLFVFFMPPPFSVGGEGHIVSPLSVPQPVRPYKNGFRSLSFEKISVLDSYFMHRYIIIKCRSSSF